MLRARTVYRQTIEPINAPIQWPGMQPVKTGAPLHKTMSKEAQNANAQLSESARRQQKEAPIRGTAVCDPTNCVC